LIRGLLWAATTCVLSNCTSVPVQAPPSVALPATWTNQQPASSLAPSPELRQWWRAFADPALDDLVDRALRDNLDVRQAALRVRAARALADQSRAEFLPTLSARTYSTPNPDSTRSYFQAGFDATWELGLFGRAKNQARAAAASVGMAEIDAQSARVSVVAEVVRAYLQLRSEQARHALLVELSAAQHTRLRLLQVRRRLQMVSDIDLGDAQVEQAAADAASTEPLLGIEQSRRQLAILVGESAPDSDLDTPASLPRLQSIADAGLPADLLRTRPEIRHAEQVVMKAAADLGIANADLYPRLSLGGLLVASAPLAGISLGTVHGTRAIGPVIDIPLFDWGARRAVVSARDAELQAAELAYRAAVLTGVGEVETALATLKLRQVQVDAAHASMQALQHADELMRTLRQQQLADDLDRAATHAKVLHAQLDLLQAREAQDLAYVALYKALGGAPLPVDAQPGKAAP
jgi:NodT family efflux transporter outer membrane factor (OMF) lipoprotein